MTHSRIPTVLVVEDEALLRLVAVEVAHDAGFNVIDASNADAALKMMVDHQDDLVVLFTDIQMPGSLDGIQLAKIVGVRWPKVKLAITSGQIRPGLDEFPKGIFLPKPYSEAQLLDAFEQLLGRLPSRNS